MLLFLDTEFTGLGQRWPRLISIGLISEDGQHSFYAELPTESYLVKCTPWVRENVLPLLEGGDCIMQPAELQQRLTAWLVAFGDVEITCDSKDYDWKFLRALLDPWPGNIKPEPLMLKFDADQREKFTGAVGKVFASGLRQHHALDDAKANRSGWLSVAENNA